MIKNAYRKMNAGSKILTYLCGGMIHSSINYPRRLSS
jgi:hypothetical protein